MKKYYEEHKNSPGLLVKVKWITQAFNYFAVEDENGITADGFVRSIKGKNKNTIYSISEGEQVKDNLRYSFSIDQAKFYLGCPLSKTGLCSIGKGQVSEKQQQKTRP